MTSSRGGGTHRTVPGEQQVDLQRRRTVGHHVGGRLRRQGIWRRTVRKSSEISVATRSGCIIDPQEFWRGTNHAGAIIHFTADQRVSRTALREMTVAPNHPKSNKAMARLASQASLHPAEGTTYFGPALRSILKDSLKDTDDEASWRDDTQGKPG